MNTLTAYLMLIALVFYMHTSSVIVDQNRPAFPQGSSVTRRLRPVIPRSYFTLPTTPASQIQFHLLSLPIPTYPHTCELLNPPTTCLA